MKNLIFEPYNFIENLKFMGGGMLGVFLVIGIIIGATYAINYLSNKASK
jgi:hypothetical protein